MARKKKSESESDTDYETDAEVDAADDAEAAEYLRAADRVEHEPEADTGPEMVEVEVVVDHVFLPVGEDGNVPAVWREVATVRVGKGSKLTVPADMLELLGDKVARVA